MSLWGTLNIGKTALAVNQAALQTVGNNIANAGNENYTRQRVNLENNPPLQYRPGLFLGTGVDISSIERQVDESLEQRLRSAISDAEGDGTTAQWLGRLEAIYNELSDEDLSSAMSQFFASWSNLANKPQDVGLRQVVLQHGANLADRLKGMRTQFQGLKDDINNRITGLAGDVDGMLQKVADLNREIATTETNGTNNTLRDSRDAVLKELARHLNITVEQSESGMVTVSVGQDQLVIGTKNRGLTTDRGVDESGDIVQHLITRDTDAHLQLGGGILGGTDSARTTITEGTKALDELAATLIFELNKLHASGQGLAGISTATATATADDPTLPLNDPLAGLDFTPQNGSFVVHVRDKATGALTSTLINVDLDGTGTQTTLEALRQSLDDIDNLTATITGGRLTINADSPAIDFGFSQDSSGALAAIGIGTFFSGSDARDIAVRSDLAANPQLLAASRNGQPADNQTAKLIAALETTSLASLGGQTLKSRYEGQVNTTASRVAGARIDSEAAAAVRDTLIAQREALSGVSLDEEAISLMRYQRAYQAASRVIAATDELLQTVLNLV